MENFSEVTDDVILARHILERLNNHFYQTYDGIGIGTLDEKEYQYLPDFHKYWQAHHAEIINARVDRDQARLAALSLHEARLKYEGSIFDVTLDTHGLSPQAIAQIRFFTANQDFREPPDDQFSRYFEGDAQFEAQTIAGDRSVRALHDGFPDLPDWARILR